jgi:hypothetical protein
MSETSIYLHLPANASGNEFPENTNSSFKIRLANRLRLDGSQWEVALLDIMYTNKWHNATEGVITVLKFMKDSDGKRVEGAEARTSVKLRKGRYRNLNDLLKEMDVALKSFESKFVFYYDEVRDLMYLIVNDVDYAIYLSQDLADIFGFKANHEYFTVDPPTSFKSPLSPDLNQGFTSLYVYCSLCEPRLVGDSLVRLLRVIPVRNVKKEKDVSEEVCIPHYVKLANTDTDVVEVNISRDDGRSVAFKGGKVWMNLHLRKASGK